MLRLSALILALIFSSFVDAATPEQQCKAMKPKAKAEACFKRIHQYQHDIEEGKRVYALAKVLAQALVRPRPTQMSANTTLACGQSVTITAPTSCGGSTTPPPTCSGGSVPVGNACECPPGYVWDGTYTNCIVPPTSGGGGCPGFNKTIELVFDWNAPGRQTATMGVNDVIVASFTTGNLDSADNNLPRIGGAEWSGPPSARFAVLSASKCDFAAQQWQGAITAGNSVNVPFAVGNGSNWGYYPKLAKNTTYYFNVKNLSTTESCSNQGICDMFIELSKPSGV